MFRQWVQEVRRRLSEIEDQYGQAPIQDRNRLRDGFRRIHQDVNQLLEAWVNLEEQVTAILKKYPDLAAEEEEVGEEFFLDSRAVRAFRQGQGYYHLKMFSEAHPYFREVVEKEPDFLLGRLYLALSDFQQGKLVDAQREFQLVAGITELPQFQSFTHHMLGCIHVKEGRDEQGIRQFEKSISIDSDSRDTWFNLGACHYRLGRYHEAIPPFFHSLRLDEEDWEAMYYLSCCYEKLGQWESVSYWRMASYHKTKHPAVMESMARYFEEIGDLRRAVHWYRKLVTADPRKATGYHGLSWNLWLLGQKRESFAVLQKGLSLEPENENLLFTYVWYLLQSGDVEQVRKALSRLPGRLADHPLWLVLKSRLSVHCRDYEEAEAVARQVIASEEPLARSLGYYQLGRVLLEKRQPDQAVDSFRKARELSPQWEEPVFYEGLCHFLNGCTEETRQCWETIPLKNHSVG
ncbi:tetratricopeptide (TPR) repeat protein [Melghirimyces profundicolus]|uniref:Tetratricopeptide (TPR) repeat protein n=1 Tax=Melghirimyces profundicolus TaxID=1242148 RepID=A0A2T6BV40_9BACL|nr:tetratricopeptide repeat protein [Melghirimyces profundicolus]PTX59939.1 tetratricopeptide (TPR) repeat protein [Melghirimyces profundicolus]